MYNLIISFYALKFPSSLQKYKNQNRHFACIQKTTSTLMPTVLPPTSMKNFLEAQTSSTANLSYMPSSPRVLKVLRSPRSLKPSSSRLQIYLCEKKVGHFENSGKNIIISIIINGCVQLSQGGDGVQIAQKIDHNNNIIKISQTFSNGSMEGGHKKLSSKLLRNSLKSINQQRKGLTIDVIP